MDKKSLRRERAKWDFEQGLLKYIDNFKSAEEPTIKLSQKEISIVLLGICSYKIKTLK